MISRPYIACWVVLVAAGAFAQGSTPKQDPENCAPTVRNEPAFVPPVAYLASHTPSGMFWYGSTELWTLLDTEGTWKESLTTYSATEHMSHYTTKLTYWAASFDARSEVEPALTVIARRLDKNLPTVVSGPASSVFVHGPMPPGMMTTIDLPTSGCWNITAKYRSNKLSFVRSVRIER